MAQQRSVALSVCPLRWDDVVINLLDTPGYPDFTGELRAGLRAADGALFVVSAADDIDPITVSLWEECAALGTPRAVVISRLDAPRARSTTAVTALPAGLRRRRRAGRPAALRTRRPAERRRADRTDRAAQPGPVRLRRTASRRPRPTGAGADRRRRAGPLIEAIINNSEDETLLERYLAGEQHRHSTCSSTISRRLSRAARSIPVLPVCAATGLGLAELLEVLSGGFPSPAELDPPAVHRLTASTAPTLPLRPGRAAARRGRAHHRRPLPRAAVGAAAVLRHAAPRDRASTSPATAARPAGTPITTPTSGSARSSHRSGRRCARSSGRSPATSARSAGWAPPRPATRSRPRPRRC